MYNDYYVKYMENLSADDNYKIDVLRRLFNSYYPNDMYDMTQERLRILFYRASNNVPLTLDEEYVLKLFGIISCLHDDNFTAHNISKRINIIFNRHQGTLGLSLILIADDIWSICSAIRRIVIKVISKIWRV